MDSYHLQEVTLSTGRRVFKGLAPHTPDYRGRLLGKRSMLAPATPPPASCLQSGSYYLNMYSNDTYGCCTGSALVEIINYVYGVKVDPTVALAWFRAHGILNGANELDVLTWAETDPVDVAGLAYKIGPSATLDYSDPVAIQAGIATNKAVYWGVDAGYLQQCVGNSSGWVAPVINNYQQNYDHAVFSPDYGTLDECATYLNKERGVTVTIGSLDPKMSCVTIDSWNTLGIVPMQTVLHTTGEAHVIESFPKPGVAPVNPPPPTPTPAPGPTPTRRAAKCGHDLAELYGNGKCEGVLGILVLVEEAIAVLRGGY